MNICQIHELVKLQRGIIGFCQPGNHELFIRSVESVHYDEKFIDGVGDKGVPNSPQESRIRLKSPCLQLDQCASNVI